MELKLGSYINNSGAKVVLIVPYGIETDVVNSVYALVVSFNRTLWN